MFALPENHYLRSILLGLTVSMTMGYAWLFAHTLEPSISLQRSWLLGVASIEGKQIRDWTEVHNQHLDESMALTRQVKELDSAVNMLGGLKQPLAIFVDFDRPQRFLVTDTRIELGSEIILGDGLIAKAVIKGWLLQKANVSITSSLLRMEIASDVISALIFEGPGQFDPVTQKPLVFRKPANWLSSMASFKSVCASPWRSLELETLCVPASLQSAGQSGLPTALAFRPLLGSILWKTFGSVPSFEREALFRDWLRALQNQNLQVSQVENLTPATLEAWRDKIRGEAEILFPIDQEKLQVSLDMARLDQEQEPQIDFDLHANIVKAERASRMALSAEVARRAGASVLLETDSDQVLLPGLVSINGIEHRHLKARESIWEACQGIQVKDLTSNPVVSDEWMYVHACADSTEVSYGPLWSDSMKAFSLANPKTGFLILRRTSVELALKRRLLSLGTEVENLLDPKNPAHLNAELGLNSPTWVQAVGAYRVIGAVEAVEWIHTPDHATLEPVN